MKKKILKIIGVVLLIFVVLVVAAPFVLEAKIGDILKKNVNNNVNAAFDFSEANLSLIKSFPNAKVELKDVTVINKAPFEGDTLFAAGRVDLRMGIGELFKGEGEPIGIKNLIVDKAKISVNVNEEEIANYEIANEDGNEELESSEGFTLNLQSYEITNSEVIYDDKAAKVYLVVSDIMHRGSGDLSAVTSELDTKTEALVTFELDSTNYLNRNKVKLDALVGVDLAADKYTFLKNEAMINQLPLVFDGYVKVNEENQEVDISFNTPSSDFKNFLALIPQAYSKDIKNVKTTGECLVKGEFKGIVDEEHIPKFKIDIQSENASFKYPDLPKTVQNININMALHNSTGIVEDTYVEINKASFIIDEDRFNLSSKITDFLGNTKVNAHLNGVLNLTKLSKAYPLSDDMKLSGRMKADISTAFDMASVENEHYENTKTSGKLLLSDFEYKSSEIRNPVKIETAEMTFNPSTVTLNQLQVITGQSDFNATGTIDNLLGFMFNEEKIEGDFNLKSSTFDVNDFMNEEEAVDSNEVPTTEGQLKIPSFLDCNISATAGTVIYDNLNLKNVRGNLRIVDEKAVLTDVTSSLFNGNVSFDGEVSTKNQLPNFRMKLNMDQLGIGESFKSLELFKFLAPVASALQGRMNSDIELSGSLKDDFTPDLKTITGKVLAELLSPEINTSQSKVLSAIGDKLNFINLNKLDLKGLKTALSFEDGAVKVKPFTIAYEDISINVNGSHTFDKKLNYKATLDVPAKYLGAEVNGLIEKIGEKELDDLTIPVIANIGGNYTSPEVTTDLTLGVKNLTSKLIDIQKQKIINKGKDKAGELIGDILSGNSTEKDSTSQENQTKDVVSDVLGGILGGSEQKNDSNAKQKDTLPETQNNQVKEAAKNILGGLLGGKKKKDTVKVSKEKDTVN
ncbi:AsmA-like C-terminal region-containing protein [Maribacter sp. HTCC2170]|uniref:AsmA-like C-terminal region-containing protein n=1 Tax=Maribacter sp. (strain HTCC2170 / KCCM 42371) TaxID=313603 RepID=UPI00006BD3F1|nr:AsmA-like C-terminal region-containing protein [Maribacter sp. HTCC2170]EAR02178.1 putative outer membrane protein [Maribacter sp. HTCC2170]